VENTGCWARSFGLELLGQGTHRWVSERQVIFGFAAAHADCCVGGFIIYSLKELLDRTDLHLILQERQRFRSQAGG